MNQSSAPRCSETEQINEGGQNLTSPVVQPFLGAMFLVNLICGMGLYQAEEVGTQWMTIDACTRVCGVPDTRICN